MLKEGDIITIVKIVRWGGEMSKHPEDIDEIIVECEDRQYKIEGGSGDELWGDPGVDNGIEIIHLGLPANRVGEYKDVGVGPAPINKKRNVSNDC